VVDVRKIILSIIFVALLQNSFSQELDEYERKLNEKKEYYVLRVKSPEDNLTYKVLESYEWDLKNPSIICFYEIPRESDNISEIIGHIYMKQYDVKYYRDIVFGNFIGESDYPEIIDVFWLNIDADSENELFVLFKYFTRHFDFTGYIYDLAILDNPTIYYDHLDSIDIFDNIFISFDGMNGDGVESKPMYTRKDEIIQKIHELGY
jgi:hypothetical protein